MGDQTRYLAYLLRLWKMENGDNVIWRAALEDSSTGIQFGFANLSALFSFLREQTGCPKVENQLQAEAPDYSPDDSNQHSPEGGSNWDDSCFGKPR